ncbi:MAG: lysylphosphatidylglycerol synthase domain-containing protein [Gaiellaceae bacterium]
MSLSRPTLIASAATLAVLAAVAAMPQLLRDRVAAAFDAISGADPAWLWLGGIGFALAFVCTVAAWRAAFAAAGGRIPPGQAAARLGIGCLVNSFAPAKLGDAVKVALCARAIDGPGRIWTAGGVYAALAAARSLALAALVVVASTIGALPWWPVLALCGLVASLALGARLSQRLRSHKHVAELLGGFAALERSPRAAAAVMAWTLGMVAARVCATAAVAAGLGIPHPVAAAFLILPALDLASALPLTPGSIGIGSGAVAVALASRGIGMAQALAVGIAIQALETLVSITAGTLGGLYLVRPNEAARVWIVRAGTVTASVGIAALVGLALLDLA